MKVFQKRPVAAIVMVLAIAAGILLGQARKPADTSGRPRPLWAPIRMSMTMQGSSRTRPWSMWMP